MPFMLRPYRRFPVHLLRLAQHWAIPGPSHDLESLLYRLASLRGPAHATRGNPLADRHSAE